MRDVLLKRIRPLVQTFAEQLTELLVLRVEVDLEHVGESLEIALSAFESLAQETKHADRDPGDARAVPQVPRGAERGLPLDEDAAVPAAAQAAPPRRAKAERAPRLVDQPEDLLAASSPPSFPADKRGRADKTALTASGKQPPTCKQCGFVGGNSRGCGTSHKTQASKAPVPEARPVAFMAIRERTYPTIAAPADRRATIAALQAKRPQPMAVEPDEDDDQDEPEPARPPGSERWTKGRIAIEAAIAEARKVKGEMPARSSSFDLGHDGAESGMASVREVGPEDEIDFEASA